MSRLFNLLGSCYMMALAFQLLGAEPQSDFESANQALAKGNYANAIAGYEKLSHQGTTAALEHNWGLACYQQGQLGQAIAHFRKAERLAPRDTDIQANLRLARSKVGKSTHEEDGGVPSLTLNEWAVVTMAVLGIAYVCWMTSALSPRFGSILKGYAWGASVLALVVCGFSIHATFGRFQEADLVVVRPDAALRQSPFADAKSMLNLSDGMELHIQEVRSDWYLVSDPHSDRSGWLKQDLVERIPVR